MKMKMTGDTMVLNKVEDRDNVNARRAEAGLMPLEIYLIVAKEAYGIKQE
jgi:phosphopantetheine adenylyltransferase